MTEDPIVAEVRCHRKALAEQHGNDIRRIVEALRQRERDAGRKVLSPGPKHRLDRTGS